MDDVVLQEEEVVVEGPNDSLETGHHGEGAPAQAHDIYTVANIITVLRLILIPMFFAVLLSGRNDTMAFILFAVAASTDWLDGQIARRTGTVTALGAAIDPLVDRLLIASGVVGVYLLDRIPLWVLVVLIVRDLYLFAGAAYMARRSALRVEVAYIGKVTTALLLIGFSDLILNWPKIPGLALVESSALPGFGSEPVAIGIWFVYAGVVTSVTTAVIYTQRAASTLRAMRVNVERGDAT